MDIVALAKTNIFLRFLKVLNGNVSILSASPLITMDFLESHLDWKWKWDMRRLSSNRSLPMGFIEAHLDWKWEIPNLSYNPSLTMDFVEAHDDWDWDMEELSGNHSLTMKFIEDHDDWDWDMMNLSYNPSLTIDFVEAHDDWNWDSDGLLSNPSIPLTDEKLAYLKETVNIGHDPSVSIDSIEANPDQTWYTNLNNPFRLDVEKEIIRLSREYLSALKIQLWFDDVAHWNPEFRRSFEHVQNSFEEIYNEAHDVSWDKVLRTPLPPPEDDGL